MNRRIVTFGVVLALLAPIPLAGAESAAQLVVREATFLANYALEESNQVAPEVAQLVGPASEVALQSAVPIVHLRVFTTLTPGDPIGVGLYDYRSQPVTFNDTEVGVYLFPVDMVDDMIEEDGTFVPWENRDSAIWWQVKQFDDEEETDDMPSFTYDGDLRESTAGRNNVLVWVYYKDLDTGETFSAYHSGARTFAWSVTAPYWMSLAYAATPVIAYTF